MLSQPPKAVIFDLGDVLFSWSPKTKTSIPPKVFLQILRSPTWFEYECGRYLDKECYSLIGEEFSIDPEEIAAAFQQARDSMESDEQLVSLIHELRCINPETRFYAMSNISLPDYQYLRATKHVDWSIFDRVFTSAEAGERKPNLGFYHNVIQQTGLDPYCTVFIDDKIENVLSARSFGIHGIVFESPSITARQLRNRFGDPYQRGMDWLKKNSGKLRSVTDTGVVVEENFAQLLILEATGDPSMVTVAPSPGIGTWNFFPGGKGVLTTDKFPDDLDTTSLGLTITHYDDKTAHAILDKMLEFVNSDGILQTYFDKRRPRIDPCVCVNACNLFYRYGRGEQVQPTLEWVCEVLKNRAYIDGTLYYATPECFLFFVSRFLASCNDPNVQKKLRGLIQERLKERIGAPGESLALAMRVVACHTVDIEDLVDVQTLLTLQCDDGGWEAGWVYKYGSSGMAIGNRGVSTAIALQAISSLPKRQSLNGMSGRNAVNNV
ncbi:HAD-like protein [Hysterangium stoloniferum]|nr:HAD-like protein [Hysterangium stoloniferum]